jgi:cob(I)alamin adenosyltransferase
VFGPLRTNWSATGICLTAKVERQGAGVVVYKGETDNLKAFLNALAMCMRSEITDLLVRINQKLPGIRGRSSMI